MWRGSVAVPSGRRTDREERDVAGGLAGVSRRVRMSWRRWVAVLLAFNIALGMGVSVVALRHQADARTHTNVLFAELDAAASAQDALFWRAATSTPGPASLTDAGRVVAVAAGRVAAS